MASPAPSSKTATGTIAKSPATVLTVAQARERILQRIRVLEPEDVALTASRDRVLAEDVRSDRDVPPFANSAMDGYAVRAFES
jgi:molybdopterin molybdotransferase